MKKEDLFKGFTDLDDNLLKRSEEGGHSMRWKKVMKWGSIAACLTIILTIGIFLGKNEGADPNSKKYVVDKNAVSKEATSTPNKQNNVTDKQVEQYIDVTTLLASNENIIDEILELSNVVIEKYHALYMKVASANKDILKASIGGKVEGTDKWFKVSGHEDLQYLILMNKKEDCSLWKFESFQSEKYPYNDVLQKIYNIYSADDIEKITSNPASMDNSDEGKAIQDEIGTTMITDKNSIKKIYHVLAGLTCYGSDNWDRIEVSDDSKASMQKYVRMGRYLALETAGGNSIDSLKYTGISGMFYEYNGIAYNKLKKNDKKIVEKILGIVE